MLYDIMYAFVSVWIIYISGTDMESFIWMWEVYVYVYGILADDRDTGICDKSMNDMDGWKYMMIHICMNSMTDRGTWIRFSWLIWIDWCMKWCTGMITISVRSTWMWLPWILQIDGYIYIYVIMYM